MLFSLFQVPFAALTFVLLKLFARLEVLGTENLKEVNKPFIAVANHESHLDPQLMGLALLYRPKLFPLRYMAKNQLFYYPGFNLIIWLLGAFRAHKKKGIGKSLMTPTKILEGKGAVIMFPEGHIVAERPFLGEGRRGAAILALTTRAQLVPVALHTPAGLSPWQLLFGRPHIVIRIGAPFYLNNLDYPDFSDENTFAATKVIMEHIGELYHQHTY